MAGLLARRWGALVGIALSVVALGLLATHRDRREGAAQPVGLLAAPAQTAVGTVTGGVESLFDRYFLLVGAQEEAARLRREVADLRRELSAVGEIGLENQRLKTLLSFKESTDLPMLPARVVGRSASTWFRTLVVDKGFTDGVSLNSPVVTANGVIGRVYQLGPSSSRVLLVTDTSSAVDAVVQRTRAQVIVEGRLGPGCRLLYLARTDDAVVGDRVVTSGLGDVFPKGLLVGQISKVEPAKGGVFRGAELTPAADLSSLEEVFVVLPRSGAIR
ncbi:MAG: rod shape-determining protein MreC [Deltaproteobacteria bacterium]|nr:rod shape-determining protein MreC [Deltaproteobacteria bacterium]